MKSHIPAWIRSTLWIVLILASSLPVSAQSWVDWTKQNPLGPVARIEDSLVYDSAAGRFIMFGGYDLNWNRMHDIWEYDSAAKTWTDVTPVSGNLPTPRWGQTMAFDPIRRKVILFGGQDDNGTYLSDTWEWDTIAKTWTNVTPGNSPVPRRGANITYDPANDRMLLVNGVDANKFYNETWSWSLTGRTWTKLTTTSSSSAGRTFIGRAYAGVTYNTSTNRLTMFGGVGFPAGEYYTVSDQNDIWELRGTVWTDITPASNNPPARGWTGFSYDAANGRIVMFGGWHLSSPAASYGDTWVFQNGAWSLIVPQGAGPLIRDSFGQVYDPARQKVVVFGGYLSDVIELTGNTWSSASITTWPPSQDQHAMAYDSDRDVVFLYGGGSPETWELTVPSQSWQWYYVGGPNGRTGMAVAYQNNRRKVLLFGGRERNQGASGARLGDTWEWDTASHTWANVSPGGSPQARDEHALAYDASRGATVLFGGKNASGAALADTWVWNGSSWTNVTVSGGPSARFGHVMAYDSARGVIVLFGGDNGSSKLNDVWEWDGAQMRWRQVSPGSAPPARSHAAFSVYDGTGGLALFGGLGSSGLLNDTWLWNGSSWTQANAGGSVPSARQHPQMVYASASQRMVMFGGRESRGLTYEMWYGSISSTNAWPAPISSTPSQGGGAGGTFYAVYRHTSGASQIGQAMFLVNSGPGTAGAAYLLYQPSTNTLMLRNDNDTAWTSGTIGSGGTLSNGQVSVSLAAAAASVSGTDVKLWLPLAFSNGFNGPKNIFMAAVSTSGAMPAGWLQKGTYFVNNGNSTPQMVSISPVTGSGMSQTFTLVYRDVNGAADLQHAFFLMNATASATRGVYLYYQPSTNVIYLRDDYDTTWGNGSVIGSGGALGNSQVTIDVPHASVTRTGTDIALSLPMSFSSGFVGTKSLYLMGIDTAGAKPAGYVMLSRFGVGTSASPGAPQIATDMRVFHPSNGMWYTLTAASNFTSGASQPWGMQFDQPLRADFDGDGQPDLVIFRPSDGTWAIKYSSNGFAGGMSYQWGARGDIPVVGDFDGDGRSDLVVFRPSDGNWLIKYSSSNFSTSATYQWGLYGDQPVRGDFDGDGKSDPAVFRRSTGTWYVRLSSTGYSTSSPLVRGWGAAGDQPIPQDFDGDGRTDLALYRPSDGSWLIWYSAGNFVNGNWAVFTWGARGDRPALGDFDGDGRADLAVWRPSSGWWLILFSSAGYSTSSYRAIQFGQPGDMLPRDTMSWSSRDVSGYTPTSGTWTTGSGLTGLATKTTDSWGAMGDQPLRADFDGDGRPDLAIYRPSSGTWHIKYSSTNFTTMGSYQWGASGDLPLPADFDGDGRTDVAVYRPTSGDWFIRYSSLNYAVAAGNWNVQWGASGDLPKLGDFDGDGKTDVTVYRPSSGQWFVRYSTVNYDVAQYAAFGWGGSGDQALPQDFDGDGKADLAVYRPAAGTWYVRMSTDNYNVGSYRSYQWGSTGDSPVMGDYDGDSRADLIIYRASAATWFLLTSSSGYTDWKTFQGGQANDTPLEVK